MTSSAREFAEKLWYAALQGNYGEFVRAVEARDADLVREAKRAATAAALREAAGHVQIEIPGEPGELVTAYGACSCGKLKADGVTKWAILWRQHIESLITAAANALAIEDRSAGGGQ